MVGELLLLELTFTKITKFDYNQKTTTSKPYEQSLQPPVGNSCKPLSSILNRMKIHSVESSACGLILFVIIFESIQSKVYDTSGEVSL